MRSSPNSACYRLEPRDSIADVPALSRSAFPVPVTHTEQSLVTDREWQLALQQNFEGGITSVRLMMARRLNMNLGAALNSCTTGHNLRLSVLLALAISPPVATAQAPTHLQLPLQGTISIVGNLRGDGDHKANSQDQWAADFVSDIPTVAPAAPGVIAFDGWDCHLAGSTENRSCYGYAVAIEHTNEPGLYSIYTHLACDDNLPGASAVAFCATDRQQPLLGDEIPDVAGQPIDPDTPIGTISDSGCLDPHGVDQCQLVHLHFAVRQGRPGVRGYATLFEGTSVNIWDPADPHYIAALPWPQAKGVVSPESVAQPQPELPSQALTARTKAITEQVAWDPGSIFPSFMCNGPAIATTPSTNCVAAAMQQHGASPQAVAFARSQDGKVFASKFDPVGLVDLVEVVCTQGTNFNCGYSYFIVNGDPPAVEVGWREEDPALLSVVESDTTVDELNTRMGWRRVPPIWSGAEQFVGAQSIGGGIRLLFWSPMKFVHASPPLARIYVAYDFDAQGHYLGRHFDHAEANADLIDSCLAAPQPGCGPP